MSLAPILSLSMASSSKGHRPLRSSLPTHLPEATLRVLVLCHSIRKDHLDQTSLPAASQLTTLGFQDQTAFLNLATVGLGVMGLRRQAHNPHSVSVTTVSQNLTSRSQRARREGSLRDFPRTVDSDGFPLGPLIGRICLLCAGSQFLKVISLDAFSWAKVTTGLSITSYRKGPQQLNPPHPLPCPQMSVPDYQMT